MAKILDDTAVDASKLIKENEHPYYDLALAGDDIAANHYDKVSVKASACLQCGHCDARCPFGVKQSERMAEIAKKFGE